MIEKLLQTWRAMAARERRGVAAAATIVVLAILYLGLFEPAWKGRQALERELPVLRGQLAQMIGLAAEARALTAVPRSAESPQAQRTALEQSIRSAGLTPNLKSLEPNGELYDLRFQGASQAAWLTWLDTTLRETRMRVVDVAITREPAPGIVSVRLVLEAPKREKR